MMGWGSKAIEIRAVESGQLDGVFMHKRTQKLRFLCERNDKVGACWWPLYIQPRLTWFLSCQVFFASIRTSSSSQVYFMALNRRVVPQ